ncbi:MAG: VCBS repeat-containing protein [Alphaproteobacteria bacterium]|nr:VCBS repeat-containing protein [Alphaproteobacteria bacterium]
MRSLLLLALVACKDGGTDDSAALDTSLPEPACVGFSDSPESWALSTPLVADYFTYSAAGLNRYWSLFDLDGDGLDDLLITAHGAHADAEEMGASWYVHFNTGEGFGAQVRWTLPVDHRELDGLYAANFVEAVLDIDGDGHADLVLATDPTTREVWGGAEDPHWRVYPGDGATGFATEPVSWRLPALRGPGAVHQAGVFTTRDLDGDGQVELVVTEAETGGNFGYADGAPHWRVHAREGQGFADAYAEWALPPSLDGYDGDYTHWTDTAYFTSATLDLTGDGLPDLVVPRDSAWPFPVFGEEGAWSWRVHENTGAGFAQSAIEWAVPDPLFDRTSSEAERVYSVSTEWRVLALDGLSPSLVVTRDPEEDAPFVEDGAPVWAVFSNTGAGFTAQHRSWSVPDEVFSTFWSGGGAADEGWFTNDLDGDGCLDLVLTAGLDLGHPESGEGAWSWQVYKGQ